MKHILQQLFSSRTVNLAFKLGFTLGAFWLALHEIDFASLSAIVKTQEITGMALSAFFLLVQIMLGSVRWYRVLEALNETGQRLLTWAQAAKLYYISVFFNCCLPGTVGGDVVRVWLAKSESVSLTLAIHSVVIDRIIALVSLGLLVLGMAWHLEGQIGNDIGYWLTGLALLGCFGLWLALRLRPFLARYARIRLIRWLLHFIECLETLLKHPLASLLSLGIAILAHVSFCLCAYAMAVSLHIDITFAECLTFIPLVLLITTIPISIGGWGVREASMVSILAVVGVPQESSLLLSVELGLMNIILSLPAALLWVSYRRKVKHEVTV